VVETKAAAKAPAAEAQARPVTESRPPVAAERAVVPAAETCRGGFPHRGFG
jgi:hypothetical protein